ncbi:hypothetical protein [Oceanobacillus sp. Castelsardo]|uniref:hypothetical protein n=1 Tax=Oceanobacillus sp. Castelsardo TaxID=1851204 RepID=UPI000838AFEA|nr:hypothetical protein [Oceanobacillus sp. Castelsardo]
MLQLGKKLFYNNPIQLLLILTCLALALLAQKLSFNIIHLSLNQFIAAKTDRIFLAQDNFSFIFNVTLPSLSFILSATLLIWMGITNLILFKSEDNKINIILRFILAMIQIAFFIFFLYTGGKVFFYFSMFILIVFVMGGIILSGLGCEE